MISEPTLFSDGWLDEAVRLAEGTPFARQTFVLAADYRVLRDERARALKQIEDLTRQVRQTNSAVEAELAGRAATKREIIGQGGAR